MKNRQYPIDKLGYKKLGNVWSLNDYEKLYDLIEDKSVKSNSYYENMIVSIMKYFTHMELLRFIPLDKSAVYYNMKNDKGKIDVIDESIFGFSVEILDKIDNEFSMARATFHMDLLEVVLSIYPNIIESVKEDLICPIGLKYEYIRYIQSLNIPVTNDTILLAIILHEFGHIDFAYNMRYNYKMDNARVIKDIHDSSEIHINALLGHDNVISYAISLDELYADKIMLMTYVSVYLHLVEEKIMRV